MLARVRIVVLALWFSLAVAPSAWADKAPFDLSGPSLAVTVTRGGETLPIARVPDLAAGDRLHIQAKLPPGQGARYLLVAAFLRGATNPPPKSWVFAAPTWTTKGGGGLDITVPAGALQALVFLAPHTGGDLGALAGAVRARPGAFVRAAQDLEQLDLDRARLEAFLTGVREIERIHPEQIEPVSTRLARTLAIKLDQSCFGRSPELQGPCLLKDQDSLVLDDSHSASMVQGLASGATADLVAQLGGAQPMGGGLYSPYIGAVMDIVRILDGMRTARFQYIPALALAHDDRLDLRLNTPPSFADPKSVLVAAMPPVSPAPAPPLRPIDPKAAYCLSKPGLVLPVDGAPLVFATGFAHDLRLQVKGATGETFDVPVRADAASGGLVANTAGFDAVALGVAPAGRLLGRWGFTNFEGPEFRFEVAAAGRWRLADEDGQALILGRTDTVRLVGGAADCVEGVRLVPHAGGPVTVTYAVTAPDALTLSAPLNDTQPGAADFVVASAGGAEDRLAVRTYTEAGRLGRFTYHAGDAGGVLEGARLDEVVALSLGGATFHPAWGSSSGPIDHLELDAPSPPEGAATRPGAKVRARVTLADGRTESLETIVLPRRPRIVVTAKTVRTAPVTGALHVDLGDRNETPGGAVIAFSIAPLPPFTLGPHEIIEVSTLDGAFSGRLTGPDQVVLADPHAAVATLDTTKVLGPSAFGPLRVRIVDDRGESNWQPLATLVRTPHILGLDCRRSGPTCKLEGTDLFLVAAVSADAKFANPVAVPEGYPGATLDVPRPRGGKLYLKLHDDPDVISVLRAPGSSTLAQSSGRLGNGRQGN